MIPKSREDTKKLIRRAVASSTALETSKSTEALEEFLDAVKTLVKDYTQTQKWMYKNEVTAGLLEYEQCINAMHKTIALLRQKTTLTHAYRYLIEEGEGIFQPAVKAAFKDFNPKETPIQ